MPELAHNLHQPAGQVYHGAIVGQVNRAGEQLSDQARTPLLPREELRRTQVFVYHIDFGEAFKRIQVSETPRETSTYYTPEAFRYMFETDRRDIISFIDEGTSRLAEGPRPVRDTAPIEFSSRNASRRETLRADLERMYVVDEKPRVLEFVATNKLRALILQARKPLITAFGETAIKRLSIVEDDEGEETLFCLVGFSGALDEARRALRSFDEQWWLDHCGEAHGKLNFDFDLI